jgi:spore maturation protein CgeB
VRVLVLDFHYRAFWTAHYSRRPGLAESSYDEQMASLIARRFGTSDAYSHHLRRLGHKAREVIFNCLPLQAAWAREHGLGRGARVVSRMEGVGVPAGRALLPRVLLAQVEEFDPDVIYVQDLASLWPGVRRRLRRRQGLLVAQIASAAPADEALHDCDLVITSFPHWVERLRSRGIDCEYLPLAFDERTREDIEPRDKRPHPLSFVGTLQPDTYSRGAHATLEEACAQLPVAVWGSGADALPSGSPILRDYRGEAWGEAMYRVLANSRVTLNRHNDVAEGNANNMRLFEATGMGAVLLTEAAPNLEEFFEPGKEVVAYRGPADLVKQARRLLENDDERRRIAAAGQRRTLTDHTYSQRIPRVAELVQARLD